MSYFPTDIPFMSDDELIENGLKKPYKKPEIIDSKDLVPVVRCRDCKYWKPTMPSKGIVGICDDMNHFGRLWKPDDFCSYGERREE